MLIATTAALLVVIGGPSTHVVGADLGAEQGVVLNHLDELMGTGFEEVGLWRLMWKRGVLIV